MIRLPAVGFALIATGAFVAGVATGIVIHSGIRDRAPGPATGASPAGSSASLDAARIPTAGGSRAVSGRDGERRFDSPHGPSDPRRGKPGSFPGEFGDEDPLRDLRDKPPEELVATMREALATRDYEMFKRAAEVLGDLSPAHVAEFSAMLRQTDDPKAIHMLAGDLVRHGGKEGLQAVAQLIQDDTLGIDARGAAIEALHFIPPERREEALAVAANALASGLPEKLAFHTAHVYGGILGPDAVPRLAEILEAGVPRPEAIANAIRDFARPEDLALLKQLVAQPFGRAAQENLLRAIGSAAGADGARTLLGYLREPPEGVWRESVGWALDEFVRRDDLPQLWEALADEANKPVQDALARAIARAGGTEAIEQLAQLAADPASNVSSEALARALHDTASKETLPLMFEMLRNARSWEASEPLAHGIARIAGSEGLQELLEIAQRRESPDARRAIVQAIEDLGDSSVVDRLGAMLMDERDHGVSFHLAKAMLHLDPTQGPQELAERMVQFPDGERRAAIADVLEKEGGPALIPTLADVLRGEGNERAQFHLARTLASYGPDGRETLGQILAADPDGQRRASILRGMESIQPEAAVAQARRLIRDDVSPEVRHTAAKILGTSQDPAVLQELAAAIAAEADPGVREEMERVLRERAGR
ncbi:MAG: HEAT repeat domain-containing protein [Planctomycetes bacterium]|nr:HEAT repeat domain-containing protein [Planctomycetota bacterium]